MIAREVRVLFAEDSTEDADLELRALAEARERREMEATPLSRLSPREREVLKLVVEGSTSKEIAAAIGVKPASVHTYRSRIMVKLEIGDIASLVRFAIRQGLIRP
jgi:DNA-binding NarL/FixJ family response regulator